MTNRRSIDNSNGFTVLEIVVAFALILLTTVLTLTFATQESIMIKNGQTISTADRIVAGVRSLAGNPAAMRNSMRATSDGVTAVNPQLLACAGGNPANSCQNQVTTPLTLYSPVLLSSGGGYLVQSISAPLGSTTPARFDAWGSPCNSNDTTCPILVYTSMTPQCAPPQMTAAALALQVTAAELQPAATCTIADVVTVNYQVQLDPALATKNIGLKSLLTPVKGSIAISVFLISANAPL